jgi:hypothetical protein
VTGRVLFLLFYPPGKTIEPEIAADAGKGISNKVGQASWAGMRTHRRINPGTQFEPKLSNMVT